MKRGPIGAAVCGAFFFWCAVPVSAQLCKVGPAPVPQPGELINPRCADDGSIKATIVSGGGGGGDGAITAPLGTATAPSAAVSTVLVGGGVQGGNLGDAPTAGNVLWVQAVSSVGTYQETTITTGGTAQSLFSGATPANGYEIINNSTTETLYFREGGTAAVGGASSIAIAPASGGGNPGSYNTPPGYKPTGLVSVIAATTGHAIVARSY